MDNELYDITPLGNHYRKWSVDEIDKMARSIHLWPAVVHLDIGRLTVESESGTGPGTVVKVDGKQFPGIKSIRLQCGVESPWECFIEWYPWANEPSR
jgi:hypothetical protein